MKATAQMGGLTAEQVEAWAAILHGSCGSNEILRSAVEGLCDLALQAIDREALRVPVREIMFEALEKLERALQPPPPERP